MSALILCIDLCNGHIEGCRAGDMFDDGQDVGYTRVLVFLLFKVRGSAVFALRDYLNGVDFLTVLVKLRDFHSTSTLSLLALNDSFRALFKVLFDFLEGNVSLSAAVNARKGGTTKQALHCLASILEITPERMMACLTAALSLVGVHAALICSS